MEKDIMKYYTKQLSINDVSLNCVDKPFFELEGGAALVVALLWLFYQKARWD
jgi:hypothetical protein